MSQIDLIVDSVEIEKSSKMISLLVSMKHSSRVGIARVLNPVEVRF